MLKDLMREVLFVPTGEGVSVLLALTELLKLIFCRNGALHHCNKVK